MSSVEVYVATHKKQNISLPDHCKFVQVNAEKQGQWEGYLHDNDVPDNISSKNNSYCELTALYLLWKNSNADIGGLFHYRRFFTGKTRASLRNESRVYTNERKITKSIISERKIKKLLSQADVILGMPRGPLPLNAFEDLQKFVCVHDIQVMIDIIEEEYPQYKQALWEVLQSTSISYCNMFIASRIFIANYCEWMFRVLLLVENRVSIESYDTSHQRILGYLAEVLLNVYVKYNESKIIYVYRADLEERKDGSKVRRIIKKGINDIIPFFGIYPLGHARGIHKARYISYKKHNIHLVLSGQSLQEATRTVERYFADCGCEYNIHKINDDIIRITAQSFYATLSVFLCNTVKDMESIDAIIDNEKDQGIPFASVKAYRVYCIETLDKRTKEQLLNKGILVME